MEFIPTTGLQSPGPEADRFVLKFLPHHLSQAEEKKQRFIYEAKAALALEHNNICNTNEIDETEDGQLFIAMAHYEGRRWIRKSMFNGTLLSTDGFEITWPSDDKLLYLRPGNRNFYIL